MPELRDENALLRIKKGRPLIQPNEVNKDDPCGGRDRGKYADVGALASTDDLDIHEEHTMTAFDAPEG